MARTLVDPRPPIPAPYRTDEREQFGRPIGDFQVTRFKIAKMASELEACRALMYQVAANADAGEIMQRIVSDHLLPPPQLR